MREALMRRSLDNVTVVMISLKNFKHKLYPRDKVKSSNDLKSKIGENGASPSHHLNRSLLTSSMIKQTVQALREKSNEQITGNRNFADYGEMKYKSQLNLIRESTPNLNKNQSKRLIEKETPTMNKESSVSQKRFTPKPTPAYSRNDENRDSGYLDYLQQQSKLLKVKSVDYKTGDFARTILKGGK